MIREKSKPLTAKDAKEPQSSQRKPAQLISTEWTPSPDNLLFLFLFSHNTKASEPCCEGWYGLSRCSPLPPAAFSAFLAVRSHCCCFPFPSTGALPGRAEPECSSL